MRISDWSSDVCSSDLVDDPPSDARCDRCKARIGEEVENLAGDVGSNGARCIGVGQVVGRGFVVDGKLAGGNFAGESAREGVGRSEEHTSELQSLMRISYAVFCLKKKKKDQIRGCRYNTQK